MSILTKLWLAAIIGEAMAFLALWLAVAAHIRIDNDREKHGK